MRKEKNKPKGLRERKERWIGITTKMNMCIYLESNVITKIAMHVQHRDIFARDWIS
tara:strand:+ start:2727 stop:2894 length:168 start_codon:yes stop_codon:yes gene_type:complete